MNEYDSDKMAEVLAESEGVVLTDRLEEADIVLFNTCSVREKAQEKVFSDLGRVRALSAADMDAFAVAFKRQRHIDKLWEYYVGRGRTKGFLPEDWKID